MQILILRCPCGSGKENGPPFCQPSMTVPYASFSGKCLPLSQLMFNTQYFCASVPILGGTEVVCCR